MVAKEVELHIVYDEKGNEIWRIRMVIRFYFFPTLQSPQKNGVNS